MGRSMAHNNRETYSHKIDTLLLTNLSGILPLGSKDDPDTGFKLDLRFSMERRKGQPKEIPSC